MLIMPGYVSRFAILGLLYAALAGCSIQNLAINSIGDFLAGGSSVFASDDDPELIEQALPFSLKLTDALLLQQPDNSALLVAAATGYAFYAYAYAALPAERISTDDLDRALELRARARNLALRAHDYVISALELAYPGIGARLVEAPGAAVAGVGSNVERDVEMLYLAAASLGIAISNSLNEASLLARRGEVDALLARALELDESWRGGTLHELAITLGAVNRASAATLEQHYTRALELSLGKRAGLFVTYAEATAVPRQDREAFVDLLNRAKAVDANADPDQRLSNVLAQRRADWLLSNIDEIFLE